MGSIAIEVIPDEAQDNASYNGFCYRYSLIKDTPSPTKPHIIYKKGMWYLGAHGSDDPNINANISDGYWQSCKNEDFKLLFCGTEPVFKQEIFYLCKNWTEAHIEEERQLLENVEDVLNGMSFNDKKTLNFIKKADHFDRTPCKEIIDEVLKRSENKWGVHYQSKKKYTKDNYEFVQVKEKVDTEHRTDVKNRINDAKGVVDLVENQYIDPALIFEGRGENGKDLVVNGNVTSGAIKAEDCLAQEVPEIRVPYEDNKHISEAQYRYIALTLNRRGKKVTKTTNVPAATKFVKDHLANGGKSTYDTPHIRSWIIQDWDLSRKQVSQVMDGVKDELFKDDQKSKNQVLPDYSVQDREARCDELRKTYPNDIVFHASVGMTDKIPHRIIEAVCKDEQEAKLELPPREPKSKVKIVMDWKQSKTSRDWWKKDDTGGWAKLEKGWKCLNSRITLSWEEMELSVDDKKGATEIATNESV